MNQQEKNILVFIGLMMFIGLAAHVVQRTGMLASPPAPDIVVPTKTTPSRLININTASVKELDRLPGIGEIMGQRIVAYRAVHGPFKKSEDIMGVKGIGPKKFERLRPLLTVE
jgi:competence ComEA-like helix-hairpin-helix protein